MIERNCENFSYENLKFFVRSFVNIQTIGFFSVEFQDEELHRPSFILSVFNSCQCRHKIGINGRHLGSTFEALH